MDNIYSKIPFIPGTANTVFDDYPVIGNIIFKEEEKYTELPKIKINW